MDVLWDLASICYYRRSSPTKYGKTIAIDIDRYAKKNVPLEQHKRYQVKLKNNCIYLVKHWTIHYLKPFIDCFKNRTFFVNFPVSYWYCTWWLDERLMRPALWQWWIRNGFILFISKSINENTTKTKITIGHGEQWWTLLAKLTFSMLLI